MKNIQRGAEWFAIAVISIGLMLLWTKGNGEAFLVDDNRLQWYPVLEKAYENFFETGKIHCYDFYQMKGMCIASQGYYGIMNPLMLVAYGIAHFVANGFSTITIYIYILVILGNIFFFASCRLMGCTRRQASLFMLMYSSCSCFFAFSYWYYVFHNYFIIPLLIYTFLKLHNSDLKKIAFGIILAFDMFLGNVQYTCYHYMLFCIVCIVMSVFGKRDYIKIMLCNVLIGIVLSLPVFLLVIGASSGFGSGNEFLYMPVMLIEMLLHSIIPYGILKRANVAIHLPAVCVMERDDNLLLYTGSIIPVLVVGVVYAGVKLCKKAKGYSKQQESLDIKETLKIIGNMFKSEYEKIKNGSNENILAMALMITILFFVSFSGGEWVAKVLNKIPVINRFRYLFKTFFVIVPVGAFLASFIMRQEKIKYKKIIMLLCTFFTLIGCVNNFYVIKYASELFDKRISGSYEEEVEYAGELVKQAAVDVKNFRTVVFFKSSFINEEMFECQSNLSRNFPTYLGSFSLSGYEIATSEEKLAEFDRIYNTEEGITTYANGGAMKTLHMNLCDEPEVVEEQLIENGVKYILLDRSECDTTKSVSEYVKEDYEKDYYDDIIKKLNKLEKISIESIKKFSKNYDLIVLTGVNSLCTNEHGESVELQDENMEWLSFVADGSKEYSMAFSYDKNLTAYVLYNNGKKSDIEIVEKEDGNIVLKTSEAEGRVYVTYNNWVCTLGFAFEIVVAILFTALLVILFLDREKMKIGVR